MLDQCMKLHDTGDDNSSSYEIREVLNVRASLYDSFHSLVTQDFGKNYYMVVKCLPYISKAFMSHHYP
jgi:hypothetical protein